MDLILKDKLIRDGKVGVLYSPGFGAGWSTWAHEYTTRLVFDPFIVDLLDKNDPDCYDKIEAYCAIQYPDMYLGGLRDLKVEWLPVGTLFVIDEYDGSESIQICNDTPWIVA